MNNPSEVVLVVDDSPESLGMLNMALNEAGYTALVALNGYQALSIVEKVEPDVILLDAVMPELDGFETCKQLKKTLPNTPIIFMTGLTEVSDVVKGFEAGGVDYVTKPISPQEVLARIKTHMKTAKMALSAQTALDEAGKNLFCVNNSGQLTWATPHVHKLVEQLGKEDDAPWPKLTSIIEKWLKDNPQLNLILDYFKPKVKLIYERSQGDSHILRFEEEKTQKAPEDLQQALPITKRESEVLYWVSYGKTNWEISQILEMSPRTVNKHLEQIFRKIDVDNRTAAAAISIRILE